MHFVVSCSQLASCLALLALPVGVVHAGALPGAPPADADADGCEASEPSPVALMQISWGMTDRGLGGESEQIHKDEPQPYGRTILSTNPRATAEWMATYYGNAEVITSFADCAEAERAAVLLDMGFNNTQLLVFVKPKTSLGSDLDPNIMIPRIQQVASELFEKGTVNYTSWLDNHDGFRANSYDLAADFEARHRTGIFVHALNSGELTTQQYVMFFFPHTMYGIQNVDSMGGAGGRREIPEETPKFVMTDCRGDDAEQAKPLKLLERGHLREPHTQYWKATFMANNPGTALDFAVKVLGASVGDSPYGWPVEDGCTGATWAQFEVSRFQLHFVNSPQYQTRNNTIKEFTSRVLSGRDLKAGKFDPYMYNSFMMTVESLDPYVQRLRAQSIDYILAHTVSRQYALFASIPDNDITFQLRSAHVSVEAPSQQVPCALHVHA